MTNDFGSITLDTVKPRLVLVPSALGTTPPNSAGNNVDHYTCYQVKVTAGTTKFARGIQVSIGDEMTTPPKTLDVEKPRHLCIATDVDGHGIKDAAVHLTCYQVKPARGQPKHVPVLGLSIADSFGQFSASTQKEDILCVPSTISMP